MLAQESRLLVGQADVRVDRPSFAVSDPHIHTPESGWRMQGTCRRALPLSA